MYKLSGFQLDGSENVLAGVLILEFTIISTNPTKIKSSQNNRDCTYLPTKYTGDQKSKIALYQTKIVLVGDAKPKGVMCFQKYLVHHHQQELLQNCFIFDQTIKTATKHSGDIILFLHFLLKPTNFL